MFSLLLLLLTTICAATKESDSKGTRPQTTVRYFYILAYNRIDRCANTPSFVHSFVRSFVRSFVLSFVCPSVLSSTRLVIHSFIHPGRDRRVVNEEASSLVQESMLFSR